MGIKFLRVNLTKNYNRYKGTISKLDNLEYSTNQRKKMTFVRIYFDTPTFDRITKDRAAKPVDMFSAIGGTMGLLTGFSVISGVEIIYFVWTIILNTIKEKGKKERAEK